MAAGILREHGPNAYDFSHDKIRDAAYAALGPPAAASCTWRSRGRSKRRAPGRGGDGAALRAGGATAQAIH